MSLCAHNLAKASHHNDTVPKMIRLEAALGAADFLHVEFFQSENRILLYSFVLQGSLDVLLCSQVSTII